MENNNGTRIRVDLKFFLQIVVVSLAMGSTYLALSAKLEDHMADTREILRVSREVCASSKTLSHQDIAPCYRGEALK